MRPGRVKRLTLAIVAAIAAFFLLPRPAIFYALHGRVVDARTRLPVPGAHVVAAWRLERSFLFVSQGRPLHLRETVTSRRGDYRFERSFHLYSPLRGSVSDSASPALYVFASGYRPAELYNEIWPAGSGHARDVHGLFTFGSSWNGKDLALEPFQGDESIQRDAFRTRVAELAVTAIGGCAWPQVAKMIIAIRDAQVRDGERDTLAEDVIPMARRCGQDHLFVAREVP
jgi:hypothetical protein